MIRDFLRFALLVLSVLSVFPADARSITVIPRPAEMTVGEGFLKLTPGFNVGYSAGIAKEFIDEIDRFVTSLNASTGLGATAKAGKGLITVMHDGSLPTEGYRLTVTPKGATVSASTAAGLFYGLQTVKQLLPPNVVAGVPACDEESYELPVVTINDSPRFPYRGYMLDVSRHFFDAAQVKKMIDLMAMYKLNRFHWHLTDDQGWRLPMEKYPRLTVEGATNQNILRNDFDEQRRWRDGRGVVYGPFAYTADEIKEIVEYARERHIEILPEVDMPGHMVAAIHAYPEFSTDPQSKLVPDSVPLDSEPMANNPGSHFTHNIWNVGGVSRDVLDVSKPEVMQFVKDVVDVLAELFPYEYIHIGGDECPTNAWSQSDSCQALKQRLGLPSDRAIQSWFTSEIANYALSKHGKKIMGWNELITDKGADIATMRKLNPVIMCWVGADRAAEVADKIGLKHIYTPHNGGYYINRSYRGYDKIGAVGDGALSLTYNTNPPVTDLCVGVQGTFWTEQVNRRRDLEYLTLPRLLAIAEHGWTPADAMDYRDFMRRARANAVALDMAGYNYARHQLQLPADR